jgi:hypothetical protein
MSGFGPYLHRVAREIRDQLFARAMAVAADGERWVLVSCDCIGVDSVTVAQARQIIRKETGLEDRQIMIHATHTHSGPATLDLIGWGERDAPYMIRLPKLIAMAAISAVQRLAEADFHYVEVPAEHIAYNRDVEQRPDFESAMREDWQPNTPEETDLMASVLRVESGGRTVGFLSSFSCHPVVCCESTHSLHGDFVGVATNMIEHEIPGAVGLFLLGSHGDINVAVCHQPQDLSMRGLNTMAARYARVIRSGLQRTSRLRSIPLGAVLEHAPFTHDHLSQNEIEVGIASHREKIVNALDGDASPDARLDAVYMAGLQRILAKLDAPEFGEERLDLQAFRLGDLRIVGTPFELYRDIKLRLFRESKLDPLLLLSMTNGYAGYAVSERRYRDAPYGSKLVPFIMGMLPFSQRIESQIVEACAKLLQKLGEPPAFTPPRAGSRTCRP